MWRRWFCKHRWTERSRTYAPPVTADVYYVASEWLRARLMAGSTAIIYTCECGAVKQFVSLGKTISADVLERMVS